MFYKADFEELDWETPFAGIRHKYVDRDSIRLRLVEYSREMPPHWCSKAHYGYVVEGIFEIEFDNETVRYEKGDALYLPSGSDHRHRGRAITEKALIFFIELESS